MTGYVYKYIYKLHFTSFLIGKQEISFPQEWRKDVILLVFGIQA